MPLLNYTTSIAADKTAHEIAAVLSKAGATQVLTDYANGRPTGLAFALDTPTGVRRYRLPVDAPAVEQVLRKQRVERRYQSTEQAERVAWRIVKDWVLAQVAIIETQMVAADQVFLPYMLTSATETIYDLFIAEQLALGVGEARVTP